MKVYELSKKLKLSNKELIEQIDDPRVTSHLSNIPEDILEQFDVKEKKIEEAEPEPTETSDSAETVVVTAIEKKSDLPDGVTPEMVWHACTGIGSKSDLWKFKDLGKKPEK